MPKIFCIGFGKTGTSSWRAYMGTLGYSIGNQAAGERLLDSWKKRDFAPIVEFAKTADAFQDFPFSAPFTYQALDAAYPNAKFILTIRDPERWYASLCAFHTHVFGKGALPTAADLRAARYVYPGWTLDVMKAVYGISEENPYEKSTLVSAFLAHNAAITHYFEHSPQSLLTLSISDPDAGQRIAEFCGVPYVGHAMPHVNRSR